jgi:outer membrane protein assembly factor BamB
VIRSVAATVVCLLAVLASAGPAWGEATTVQADADHSGDAGAAGLRLPLERRWVRPVDGVPGYPVIAEGRIFIAVARESQRGSYVIALAAGTGRVLWTHDLGAASASAALAYEDGRLFVTRESYYDGISALLALDAARGRVLWEATTAIGLFTATAPVAFGGTVYVNGFDGWGVSAFRGIDGGVVWHVTTDSGHGGSPAVSSDAVFAAMSSCPDVHRFRRGDGAELWHPENGCHGGGGSVPVLYRNRLYVTESPRYPPGDVYDAGTGAIVGPMRADSTPAFARDVGVFPDARKPGERLTFGHQLEARGLRDSRVRWRFRGDGYLDSAPLIVDGTVYVGSGSGRVYGVSLRSGRRVWSASAGAPVPAQWDGVIWSGLAAGERVLIVPALGRVAAFG